MAKNSDMIFSQIHEILTGSIPLSKAFQQPSGVKISPYRRSKEFERVCDFSLEELSEENKLKTMDEIIKAVKEFPSLTSQHSSNLKLLESLYSVIKTYISKKSKIKSIDDFVAKRHKLVDIQENYKRVRQMVEESRKEVLQYKTQVRNTKENLDSLKKNWLQLRTPGGYSDLGLLADDIKLTVLQKKYDQLTAMFYEKFNKYKEHLEKKDLLGAKIGEIILSSFENLENVKKIEKQMACEELTSIVRNWDFIRTVVHRDDNKKD